MLLFQAKFAFVTGLLGGALASINPVSVLHITNKEISPDGFTREYVHPTLLIFHVLNIISTVPFLPDLLFLAHSSKQTRYGANFDVSISFKDLADSRVQGQNFNVHVFNDLKDTSMDTVTAVVSCLFSLLRRDKQ